jgi:hypothetical protein
MMRSATGLGWSDILEPQVPALAATALIVSILWAIDTALANAVGSVVVLIAQASAATLFMLGFAWWCPFQDVRMLMHEVVNDLSPRIAAFVWKDVATARRAARTRGSEETATLPSSVDGGARSAS